MVERMLDRYEIYILCFKGDEMKERNCFLSSFERGNGADIPKTFTMLIKERGAFYKMVGGLKGERERNLLPEGPFPTGVVTESIMDLREYAPFSLTSTNYFDVFPCDEFEPCTTPRCFCDFRGFCRGNYHLCPFCHEAVVSDNLKGHIRRWHQLGFYPTLAELPRSVEVLHQAPVNVLAALRENDHREIFSTKRGKRKRGSSANERIVGSADRLPSEERTNLSGASSPLLPE